MDSKFIGGVLLVTGTTIGAGMLALPIATAQLGFIGAMSLLIVCWLVMTASALLFLEVNLWLPENTNLVSMAGATLGKPGQMLTWTCYLLLLYTILSAYIAGGGDLINYVLNSEGIPCTLTIAYIIFTGILGSIVYSGVRSVDYVNRGFMFGKLGAFILLVFLIFPYISFKQLISNKMSASLSPASVTVTAVSFGSLMIIPTLRNYFGNDHKKIARTIFVGMLIPFLCYLTWEIVVMGVVPAEGAHGLKKMLHSTSASSDLVIALQAILQNPLLTFIIKFFTSICMATSFLSVSLSLSDFLVDGFGVVKQGMGNFLIFGFTFLPPLAIVLFYPDAFIRGLNYAGIYVFVLMILLPPLMAWRGRYHHDLGQDNFKVRGGKFLLALLVIFAILMLIFGAEEII